MIQSATQTTIQNPGRPSVPSTATDLSPTQRWKLNPAAGRLHGSYVRERRGLQLTVLSQSPCKKAEIPRLPSRLSGTRDVM